MLSVKVAESPQDRTRALGFVRRHVRRVYGGIPPPSQVLLFAEERGRICGTIALDFADEAGQFHLETIYSFDCTKTPWLFERIRIAQFGKWWATRPGTGVHLMQAAHLYAIEKGKELGLVEAKAPIVERVARLGMRVTEVRGAILQIRGLSSRGEGYYLAPPPPKLYMFDIRANAEALERYVASLGRD